jgi:hypothetical protein
MPKAVPNIVARDPVAHVASWLTKPEGAEILLAMIAECEQLHAGADEISDRADKIANTLPESIARKPLLEEDRRLWEAQKANTKRRNEITEKAERDFTAGRRGPGDRWCFRA